MKFTADGMLGSLARKMRLYGMDVTYKSDIADDKLIEQGLAQERIILTSDKELHKAALKAGVRSLLVSEATNGDRIVKIFHSLGIREARIDPENSRCPACNGLLKRIGKEKATISVPPAVARKRRIFYQCESCGKIFWKGSHWKRITSLAGYVERRLKREKE